MNLKQIGRKMIVVKILLLIFCSMPFLFVMTVFISPENFSKYFCIEFFSYFNAIFEKSTIVFEQLSDYMSDNLCLINNVVRTVIAKICEVKNMIIG